MVDIGFARPTLAGLVEQVRSDFLASLAQDDVLRRADVEVQAAVQAAALHTLYGFVQALAGQILPDTATGEWLYRHGAWWGVTPKDATPSAGSVTLTTAPGSIIPIGTRLQRSGVGDYLSTQAVAAAGAQTVVPISAATAGAAFNAPSGQTLTLVSPIAGVGSVGTASALSGGTDAEAPEDFRSRLRERIQSPPHGGNPDDYVAWAKAAPNVPVASAWVFPKRLGPGTVGLTFTIDGRVDYIPTLEDVALVQSAIDAVRPATADVTVFRPLVRAIDIEARIDPDTPSVRAAILAELADFFMREADPRVSTLRLSRLREAISLAAGESWHDLISPAADVSLGNGEIATLGTVTWS